MDFELASGSRVTAVLIAGHTTNVTVRRCSDRHTSDATGDMSFLEATWGGDERYSWHPHGLLLEDLNLEEYVDAGHTASARGIHISGAYDVTVRNLRVRNSIWPITFYIGDPGDPGGSPLAVNPAQIGKIATGLLLDGLFADYCNIGLRVLGDAAGSTTSERGTHSVRLVARNVHITGMGAIAPTIGSWLSNLGIYTDSANDVAVIGGELKELYGGFVNRTPPLGAQYTANTGFLIEGLVIHSIARQAIAAPGLAGARIIRNVLYDLGQVAP